MDEPNIQQVSYASTLINWPFKGNESALQALEQHDLIAITHKNGRPADIVPGKPIYRTAFKQLVNGESFIHKNITNAFITQIHHTERYRMLLLTS